jgi:hypothetical protein
VQIPPGAVERMAYRSPGALLDASTTMSYVARVAVERRARCVTAAPSDCAMLRRRALSSV